MARRPRPETGQGDLFATADELFPLPEPVEAIRPIDLSLRIKTAMGRALKEAPDGAEVIAAKITAMTGRELTADALYAYTAPSKPDHDMGIARFVAFVRATNAPWLWAMILRDDGLTVLEGREAHLARLGFMRQEAQRQARAVRELERTLAQAPVTVKRRGRS